MDGAQACYLYPTVGADAKPQRVGGRGVLFVNLAVQPLGVSLGEADASADLGGSSK